MSINGFVTGRIGVGKTTVCERVIELVQGRGFCVSGVLTPALLDQDGQKVGIQLVDLATEERRILGRLGRDRKGLMVGKYTFDRQVLQWGCHVLDRAAAESCDLFVVDEIGPLELKRELGFTRALRVLESGILPRTLIVVRESLLDAVRAHAHDGQSVDFHVTQDNRSHIAADIAQRLLLRTVA